MIRVGHYHHLILPVCRGSTGRRQGFILPVGAGPGHVQDHAGLDPPGGNSRDVVIVVLPAGDLRVHVLKGTSGEIVLVFEQDEGCILGQFDKIVVVDIEGIQL